MPSLAIISDSLARRALQLLAAVLVVIGSASATLADWQGTWMASGEEWRMVEVDGRVFGDIGNNGIFEGRVSDDGQKLRAAFRFGDGRWGFTEMRLYGADVFAGLLTVRDFPVTSTSVWTGPVHVGERLSPGEPAIASASAESVNYPPELGPAPHPDVIAWLNFGPGRPDIAILDAAAQPDPEAQSAESEVNMWEGSWDTDGGTTTLHVEGNRVFGTVMLVGSTGKIDARLSASGRVVRGVIATSPVVPDPPDQPSLRYFEISMNGDNLSFSGFEGSTIEPGDQVWHGYKQDGAFPPPAGGADGVYNPPQWAEGLSGDVVAWLAFSDLNVAQDQGYGIGEWRVTMSGSRIGPMGHGAILRLSAPDADGMVHGNLNAYDPGSAVILGRMFSASEFRGLWMTLDDTGRNPVGSWGTIRLVGHPSSRQFTGWWALGYRAPMPGGQLGVPGGQIKASINVNPVMGPLESSITSARANLRYLSSLSDDIPALFRGVRPDAGIAAALEAWWTEGADICAAGCLPPEPRTLVITPATLWYDAGFGGLAGERTTRIYGTLSALVQYRDGTDGLVRAVETPRWVDTWHTQQDQRVAVSGWQSGIFGITPPPAASPYEELDCPSYDDSPLANLREPLVIELPEGLFSDPDRDIIVNLEANLWQWRDWRQDRQLGTGRLAITVKAALAEKYADNIAHGDPATQRSDVTCLLDRSQYIGVARGNQDISFRTLLRLNP